MNNISFVIGRFQPFHKGHKALIDKALSLSKRVVVFLGSSQEFRTEKNPFGTSERMQMILAPYPEIQRRRLIFIPLPDYQDHNVWLKHIQDSLQLISQGMSTFTFVCSNKDPSTAFGNSLVSSLGCVDTYTTHPPFSLDATTIRQSLKERKLLCTIEGLLPETFELLGNYRKLVPHYKEPTKE